MPDLGSYADNLRSQPLWPEEKRIELISIVGQFRPANATPTQFYNYVREYCIMQNCSIDEALMKSPSTWSQLSQCQRQSYESKWHATLPIPIPPHLVYRALQMERAGRWTLIAKRPSQVGRHTTYSLASYAPPAKPTPREARIQSQRARFDNLAEATPFQAIPQAKRLINQRIPFK